MTVHRKRFFIETYGCALNQADSAMMRKQLFDSGYIEADNPIDADVIILNTCTVKQATESKIFENFKRYSKLNKPIVIAGCLYRRHERFLSINPNISIISPGSLRMIVRAVESSISGRNYFDVRPFDKHLPMTFTGPVVTIPISEGCLGSCTFCETRLSRGRLRSKRPEYLRSLVTEAVENKAVEVRLTAQDTGCYGIDIGTSLTDLLHSLLEIEGDFMIRLGMINPEHAYRMLDDLIEIYTDKKMFKFLHIPVQSGSDKVLKDMNRRYSVDTFVTVVERFRQKFPDMTISTDIIIGYPTESEEDFRKTVDLIKRMRFEILNISRFTPRPGTPAVKLKPLDNKVVKQRVVDVSNLHRVQSLKLNKQFINRELDILMTGRNDTKGTYIGRTRWYKKVAVPYDRMDIDPVGRWIRVKIMSATESVLIGEPVKFE